MRSGPVGKTSKQKHANAVQRQVAARQHLDERRANGIDRLDALRVKKLKPSTRASYGRHFQFVAQKLQLGPSCTPPLHLDVLLTYLLLQEYEQGASASF